MCYYKSGLCSIVGTLLIVGQVVGFDGSPIFSDPTTFVDAASDAGLVNQFGTVEYFSFGGGYAVDPDYVLLGNRVLAIRQLAGQPVEATGAGFNVFAASNGENGIDATQDGADTNSDVANQAAVNAAIDLSNGGDGTQGNRLTNGNAIRFSAWIRSDPLAPIFFSPQIEPMLKFEFYKEALSDNQDTNPGQVGAAFGDEIFDQEQHGLNVPLFFEDKNQWIDIDGDGIIGQDPLAGEEGRASTIVPNAWTLVSTTMTIDDEFWTDIGANEGTGVVGAVEEIRPVFFVGDFSAGTENPTTLEKGSILVDNILFEVFPDRAEADRTVIPNPSPTLSEGSPFDLNADGSVDFEDVNLACSRRQPANVSELLFQLRSILGDADGDRSVLFNDFTIMNRNFGQAGTYTDGDFNCDGEVGFSDFLILSANFGLTGFVDSVPGEGGPSLVDGLGGGPLAQARSIPEPSGVVLFTLSLPFVVLVVRSSRENLSLAGVG